MQRRGRGSKILWAQVVLAMAYAIPLSYLPTLTGNDTLDGIIGVMLGLYISSHPGRNAIDVLFADRFALRLYLSARAGIAWLALNVLALFAGWLVIFIGVMRVVRDFR